MSDTKKEQLGMNPTTASAKLKKMLLFNMIQRLGEDVCFRCKEKIKSIDDLTVEHKTPWLHSENPVEFYFNLNNIAFSHAKCNLPRPRISSQVELICDECHKSFKRLEHVHKKRQKRGIKNVFCSMSCRSKWFAQQCCNRDRDAHGRFISGSSGKAAL